jgi:hypothetical protein
MQESQHVVYPKDCLVNDVLQTGHGAWGGWHLYTRIEPEECVSCWFGLSSKWKPLTPTPWKRYKKDGFDLDGSFETKLEAYRKARKACEGHLKEFESK